MPQEFCIYKCYSCSTFQVHIVKKSSKKWVCKMCGEKQTIIKVFGQGSAKDCREHVQKLNLVKGMSAEPVESENTETVSQNQKNESVPNKRKLCEEYSDEDDQRNVVESESQVRVPSVKISKWSCFLDSDSDVE
ncbi:MRN complex-interacting protein-like [Daphnia pulex]|uniref:MRN complex-interacting protein-like n=1 Tax=Daphnia pulex TaxID=6669 RepID=UPI001EE12FDE|nr:MRN complex-interacting protein-like [Daphnia pulex]